ncbi:MAG: hypothetical protein WDW38_007446 [Sanguina aurantia]
MLVIEYLVEYSLMYGVLGNPAFAEDIAIETGNTAFLKFLLTSPLAASIKHEFLAFFEVSYNKIIRHQRNPLPMIKIFTDQGARSDLIVYCLTRKDVNNFPLALEYIESVPVGSPAAGDAWYYLSKAYQHYISDTDGPSRKGPGSYWSVAIACARKVPEGHWLRTSVWEPIFEAKILNSRRGIRMTPLELGISEESAAGIQNGWECMLMVAEEYRMVGDVAGAERCEARAADMQERPVKDALRPPWMKDEAATDEDEGESGGDGEGEEGSGVGSESESEVAAGESGDGVEDSDDG